MNSQQELSGHRDQPPGRPGQKGVWLCTRNSLPSSSTRSGERQVGTPLLHFLTARLSAEASSWESHLWDVVSRIHKSFSKIRFQSLDLHYVPAVRAVLGI